MKDYRRHLDPGSLIVIALTLALFVTAIFVKGLGHDLLLEAGVFLVSVKLILMAYKNGAVAKDLTERLEDVRSALSRLEESARRRAAGERSAE